MSKRKKKRSSRANQGLLFLCTFAAVAVVYGVMLYPTLSNTNKAKVKQLTNDTAEYISEKTHAVRTKYDELSAQTNDKNNWDKATVVDYVSTSPSVLTPDENAIINMQRYVNLKRELKGLSPIQINGQFTEQTHNALQELSRADLLEIASNKELIMGTLNPQDAKTSINQNNPKALQQPINKNSVRAFALMLHHYWLPSATLANQNVYEFQHKINDIYKQQILDENGYFDSRTRLVLNELPQNVYDKHFATDTNYQQMLENYQNYLFKREQHHLQCDIIDKMVKDVKKLPKQHEQICLSTIDKYIREQNPKIDLEVNKELPSGTFSVLEKQLKTLNFEQLQGIQRIIDRTQLIIRTEPKKKNASWWHQFTTPQKRQYN